MRYSMQVSGLWILFTRKSSANRTAASWRRLKKTSPTLAGNDQTRPRRDRTLVDHVVPTIMQFSLLYRNVRFNPCNHTTSLLLCCRRRCPNAIENTKSMWTVLGGGRGGNYVENLALWKARWSYKAPVTPTREADLSARISTDFPSS